MRRADRRSAPDVPNPTVVLPTPPDRSARPVVASAPETEVAALATAAGVPPLVARLLWLRGLRDGAAAETFLAPRLAQLEPPSALPDMDAAAARIAAAVEAGEKVAVCGDYDVDGMTGTALLVRFLRLVGADVVYAIPDRVADGYGLSVGTVERLAAEGVSLAVTVDNGVTAFDALERAVVLGVDVVVTDHHLPGERLPPAVAVVDPQRKDVPGGGASLCGCGLAFKLAWGVTEAMGRARRDERLRAFLVDAVGLVALATVADVVPLVGENRVLVAAGLTALEKSRHPGVRALLDVAGLVGTRLSSDDVVWKLAPRLNAAGRMNTPSHAIDLFTTEDPAEASALVGELEAANTERRRIEKGVTAEAMAQAAPTLSARRSVVVAGDGWHRGVIGIVAARLVDAHARPSVVIGLDADGGRGSCRTTGGVHLVEALSKCGRHLRRFGGHAAAAGLEVAREAVPAFAEAFDEAVRAQTGGAPTTTPYVVDAEASPGDFSLAVVEQVRRLAPFGAGNPEPRFLVRGAQVAGRARLMGSGNEHLSFAVRTPTGAIRVVAFRQGTSLAHVPPGATVDLVVTPSINTWNGVATPELMASAVLPPEGPAPAPPA